jgi:zinc transporter ZupT
MLELILVGCFTGFFLATVRNLVDVLSIFIPTSVINAVLSIIFASVAVYLVEISTTKQFILWTVAGAFLGAALLAIVERVSTYRPAVVNTARD